MLYTYDTTSYTKSFMMLGSSKIRTLESLTDNVKKYISITDTSKATATRDLQELTEMNVFVMKGAGRATSYQLII